MKVLHVIPHLGCGGAEILTGAIARYQNRNGHDARILHFLPQHKTWRNFPDKENFMKEVPIKYIESKVNFKVFKRTIADNHTYGEYIESFKPDIIHSHLFLAELVSRSYHYPKATYISHGHDNMPQLSRFKGKHLLSKNKLTNLWERRWLMDKYKKTNTSFIAISRDVHDYLQRNISGYKPTILHLPNAIEIQRFANNRNYRSDLKKGIRLISIANLVPKKNHIILPDLVKILLQKGIPVHLEVLGDGPLKPLLEQKVQTLGLDEHVFFRGSVGDIPDRLSKADLYVHPALYEPFGLVLLEAMASGLPVVSMDGFGNRGLILDGENGFMLPNQASAMEFAERVLWFIEQPEAYSRMGENARKFSESYDMHHYTVKLISFYEECMARNRNSHKGRVY